MHLPHVEDNGNGKVGVFYQPTEAGPHSLDVRYNGEHVQGSPYQFFASPNDEGKVYAYGPGLIHGLCGDSANFVISTKGAGAGGLALAVEGPSKADINCIDKNFVGIFDLYPLLLSRYVCGKQLCKFLYQCFFT